MLVIAGRVAAYSKILVLASVFELCSVMGVGCDDRLVFALSEDANS